MGNNDCRYRFLYPKKKNPDTELKELLKQPDPFSINKKPLKASDYWQLYGLPMNGLPDDAAKGVGKRAISSLDKIGEAEYNGVDGVGRIQPFLKIEKSIHNDAVEAFQAVQKKLDKTELILAEQINTWYNTQNKNADTSNADKLIDTISKTVDSLFESVTEQLVMTASHSYLAGWQFPDKVLQEEWGGVF